MVAHSKMDFGYSKKDLDAMKGMKGMKAAMKAMNVSMKTMKHAPKRELVWTAVGYYKYVAALRIHACGPL